MSYHAVQLSFKLSDKERRIKQLKRQLYASYVVMSIQTVALIGLISKVL